MTIDAARNAIERQRGSDPLITHRLMGVFAIAAAVASGCADSDIVYPPGSPPETVIVAFRDGVSPSFAYNGTRDAFLKNGPTNDFRNRCYGNVPYDTIGAVPLAGALYERRLVIKMDVSAISDCGTVISTTLSLAFEDAPPDSITLTAHRILRPSYSTWIEGLNGLQEGVSWLTIDGAEAWYEEGGDIEGEPFARARIAGDTVIAFAVPPVLVRGWIADPAATHGVLIRSAHPSFGRFTCAHLRETPVDDDRPRLEIKYLRSG
jgi:hypothetical protein